MGNQQEQQRIKEHLRLMESAQTFLRNPSCKIQVAMLFGTSEPIGRDFEKRFGI